jgi:hypothetical protein
MKKFFACFVFVVLMWAMTGCVEHRNSNGLTNSQQEYWDSRTDAQKVEILDDYYKETNPYWFDD